MLNDGYFRFPAIQGDLVAFVCEDDLWTVPASGGVAVRLTANLAEVSRPAISPDGQLFAFTSREEKHAEVYVMPAGGGPARRLTYLGADSLVRGFLPDGRIVFASNAAAPFFRDFHLWAVGTDGGGLERLPLGPANEIAVSPDGRRVLGRHTGDPARWKRYRGGAAGDLWVEEAAGRFRRLLEIGGNLAHPMWVGERIYFISDHEGIGNLYSCLPDGSDLRRHTDHDTYYARFAASDGRRIVYQHAAELWLYDPATDAARRIEVELTSPRTQRNRRFVDAARYLTHYALHPEGHSLAIETRGKPFTMPLWERGVRQYGRPDGVRYRFPQWLSDGATLLVVSDEGGQEAVELYGPDPLEPPRRIEADLGRPVEVVAAPRGPYVAVANHRNELHLLDTATGAVRLVDRSDHRPVADLAWSADGRWLAYAYASSRQTSCIKLCRAESGETREVTRPQFRDFAPAFDPEGRYLYFLSYRAFNPVYDSLFFDLGFPRAARPYAVALRSDVPSPFEPEPRGLAARNGERPGAGGGDGAAPPEPQPLEIDLEGLADRVVAFPLPEANYTRLRAVRGKVLFVTWPVEGALEDEAPWFSLEPKAKGSLEVFDLSEQRHEVLVPGVTDFEVARDGVTLVYRAQNRLRAIRAGEKPDERLEREPPGRRSGWIDLGRVKVSVDPAQEWRQMFREAWRLQRDHFWVEDMSGVDWEAVYRRYLPLVDKVASRLEFSDLIWEMQGELGTSHAYEIGGDHRQPPSYDMGHLAADFVWDEAAGAWRVARIVRGDPWDPRGGSPLAAPGVGVSEGDLLVAVNGRAATREQPPGALLVHQADAWVELTVARADGSERRTVSVRALRDDRRARYREWVEANRRRVREATGGRVGYVHIPDMGPHGYAEFHRSYLSEVEREALIVDVRRNGGGHVSSLLLEKLARRRVGYAVTRWGQPEPYPEDSPAGPLVAVTDESAGSDGDIFSHCFKLMGLGPLVGKRTWGGVIGIWARHPLVDGTITTQPEFSFWFADVGFGVENYGTDPDCDVDITPQDHAAGRDPQLEKAIELVLEALDRHRPLRPNLEDRPRLGLPRLPART